LLPYLLSSLSHLQKSTATPKGDAELPSNHIALIAACESSFCCVTHHAVSSDAVAIEDIIITITNSP